MIEQEKFHRGRIGNCWWCQWPGIVDQLFHWITGFKNKEYYDNQASTSAMLLEENGKQSSSKKTHNMNIQYFLVLDQMPSGELTMKHCPTSDMVADHFTMPLKRKKGLEISIINCECWKGCSKFRIWLGIIPIHPITWLYWIRRHYAFLICIGCVICTNIQINGNYRKY